MAFWGQRERVALGFGPDRVRMLVARGNGTLTPGFSGAEELPEGAIQAGLRSPVIGDPAAVHERLVQLVGEARGRGLLRRRPELVTVLVPDASVKLATAPVEGDSPGADEGDRMARWALGDLLPGDPESARVDWSLLRGSGGGALPAAAGETEAGASEDRWLLALGAEDSVAQEYEEIVERLGWSVGRLVPWTLALAVGAARAAASGGADESGRDAAGEAAGSPRLLLCDADGSLACLFEAAEVPRFHRAWRARVPAERIGGELPGLRRYINERLEMGVSESWLCGPDEGWSRTAEAACREAGLHARVFAADDALLGGLYG